MRSGKPQTTASSRTRSGCHSNYSSVEELMPPILRSLSREREVNKRSNYQALRFVMHSTAASGMLICLRADLNPIDGYPMPLWQSMPLYEIDVGQR